MYTFGKIYHTRQVYYRTVEYCLYFNVPIEWNFDSSSTILPFSGDPSQRNPVRKIESRFLSL